MRRPRRIEQVLVRREVIPQPGKVRVQLVACDFGRDASGTMLEFTGDAKDPLFQRMIGMHILEKLRCDVEF